MARKKTKIEPKEHITRDVLLNLLKTGLVLAVAVTAPGALVMFKPFMKKRDEFEEYYPSSVNRQLSKLWRKGFVDVEQGKDGYTVKISEKGRTEILKYDINDMDAPIADRWDGKWRMVMFDIPRDKEFARAAFRRHLNVMGFFQMQKSVYVHPYPCRKQVQFLREVYDIPHAVKLAVIETLENDEDLRKIFKLNR